MARTLIDSPFPNAPPRRDVLDGISPHPGDHHSGGHHQGNHDSGDFEPAPQNGYRDAIVHERARMSREIHDTLAQNFIGILLQLEAAAMTPEHTVEFIDRIRQLAQDGVTQSRKTIEQLRDVAAEETSFDTTLRLLLHRFCGGSQIDYNVIVEGPISRIGPQEAKQLRSIALEAIVNAIRHAKPTLLEITIDCRRQPWNLTVCDNGCGMDRHQIALPRLGQGIANMGARAKGINANLSFKSRVGKGTVVTISGPASNASVD